MSLPSALITALLLGDQYGLQLHGEFVGRTARIAPLNVGQVYATLERLVAADQVDVAGTTSDGLTLYTLTVAGRATAVDWTVTPSTPLDWHDMREQVMLVSSLPDVEVEELLGAYEAAWTTVDDGESGSDDLGASIVLRGAALAWLSSLAPADLASRQRPLMTARPRRGRRPAA